MSRNILHFLVDGLLLLLVLTLASTGLLMAFVLPPGHGGLSVWGLTRHQWGTLHYWVAIGMLTLATLHVLLNWARVCAAASGMIARGQTAPRPWQRRLAAAGFLLAVVVLVGGFLWMASGAVGGTPNGGRSPGGEHGSGGHGPGGGHGAGWGRH